MSQLEHAIGHWAANIGPIQAIGIGILGTGALVAIASQLGRIPRIGIALNVLTRVALAALAVLAFVIVRRALRDGWLTWDVFGTPVTASDNPVSFWSSVAVIASVGFLALRKAVAPDGRGRTDDGEPNDG